MKTSSPAAKTANEWPCHLFTALTVAAFALALAQIWRPAGLPARTGWPEAALLLLATAGTLAALARSLPLQNVVAAACFIGLVGGAADWLDLKTEIPFGPVTFSDALGPRLFKTLPWALPLIWILAILNSRGAARLCLRPWRKTRNYGFWLIGVTMALMVLFDFALEPFAARVKHYWFWEPTKFPVDWQGAPLADFLGRAVVTLLILAFVTPLLINKQPRHRRSSDFHPLGIWLGAMLLFGLGAAAQHLWTAAAADGVAGLAVAALAVRGARW